MKKKFIFILIAFVCVFLIGCNNSNQNNNNEEIISIEVDKDTYKENYYLNDFTFDGIYLIINYEKHIDYLKLREVMKKYDNDLLFEENAKTKLGKHSTTIKYENCETSFSINTINKPLNNVNINYYVNDKIVYSETFPGNYIIKDLYDYCTTENDTIWYTDKLLQNKIQLPYLLTESINLYTNNESIIYKDGKITYKELQDGTYMAYDYNAYPYTYRSLIIKEKVNNKLVTKLSNNLLDRVNNRKERFDVIFIPKTVKELPLPIDYDENNNEKRYCDFAKTIYYVSDENEELKNINPNYKYSYHKEIDKTQYIEDDYPIAIKLTDYFIEDEVIYGHIDNKLYLLDYLFDYKMEFTVPTSVRNEPVYGIMTQNGLGRNIKKIIIPQEIKEVCNYTLGYNDPNNTIKNVTYIFMGKYSDYKFDLNRLAKGTGTINLEFINEDSTNFLPNYDQLGNKHMEVILKFKDGETYHAPYEKPTI